MCEWHSEKKIERCCYCVSLQSIGKIPCSFITNLVGTEVQCGESLVEKHVNNTVKERRSGITLFVSRTLA